MSFYPKKYNVLSSKKMPTTDVKTGQDTDNSSDFTDLFGVWSESDVREFCRSVEEFDEIDPEDWH